MIALRFSLVFILIYLMIRLSVMIFTFIATRNITIFKGIDFKYDLLLLVSIFTLSFIMFSLLNLNDNSESFTNALIALLISLIPLFTIYFLGPIRYLFRSKNYVLSEDYSSETKKFFKDPINVILMNNDDPNAFATGIIPFSKTIILNTGLYSKLNNEEIVSLLLHEIGHHKKNHMLKLFFVNMVWSSITITFFNYLISPKFNQIEFFPAIIALYYGLVVTGGSLLIAGKFQKKFEYEADIFAVTNKNANNLINALIKLHDTTGISHDQWTLNYPSLNQRINKIKIYANKS